MASVGTQRRHHAPYFPANAVCSFLLISIPLIAQEATPETEGWQVVERCLSELPYPTIPQSQWDFEGVIFSENQDGVRAIRTDVDTSYFVALEGEDSFPSVGGFSPDGRWFTYPVGYTNFNVNSSGSEIFWVDEVVVVSTTPQRTEYRIPWQTHEFGFQVENVLLPVHWIDNEHFVYGAEDIHRGGNVNPFTGEFEEWTHDFWLGYVHDFSPDSSRAIYFNWHETPAELHLYDVLNDTMVNDLSSSDVLWLPDSSGYFMVTSEEQAQNSYEVVSLYDHDGEFIERIAPVSQMNAWGISPDGSQFAFIDQDRLQIANIEDRQIYNTCLSITRTDFYPSMSLAWSPDSQSIAFLFDSYPVLLNTETLAMQILQYQTGEIIGWYPLE